METFGESTCEDSCIENVLFSIRLEATGVKFAASVAIGVEAVSVSEAEAGRRSSVSVSVSEAEAGRRVAESGFEGAAANNFSVMEEGI